MCIFEMKCLHFTVFGSDGYLTSTTSTQIRNTSPMEITTSKVLDTTMDGYGQTYSYRNKTTGKSTGSTIPNTGNL